LLQRLPSRSDVTELKATVIAFQRRWRPANIDGVIDAETRTILRGLLV
jgi:N-acetylmuramoyl-L-alanine amidase